MDLSPLEVATHFVFGTDGADRPLPTVPRSTSPLHALEEAIVPALERGRCLVAFSGGRDSSAVLATAARAARSHGLPPPVPVTLRFAGAPAAEESRWQEMVVEHLGLSDWERIEIADELELLGSVDRAVLARHGLRYPANGHAFVPLLEVARGDTLLTGLDGDMVLGAWPWASLGDLLAGRRSPEPRDALRLAKALAPRAARTWWEARRVSPPPWLRPTARERMIQARAAYAAGEPRRWDARMRWCAAQRYLLLAFEFKELLARDAGARIEHPLSHPAFLAALGAAEGRWGIGDRTAAMRAVFAPVLPDAVSSRRTKAVFTAPFFGSASRAFAESWSGDGVDPELVDVDALRAAWRSERPDFRSALLLKSAWLADHRPEQHIDGAVESIEVARTGELEHRAPGDVQQR